MDVVNTGRNKQDIERLVKFSFFPMIPIVSTWLGFLPDLLIV